MTKEITKAKILQEMQDKFKLRDYEATKFLFDETVIPVYNIEQHIQHFENPFVTVSITGTGAKLFFTVPDDEKWHLNSYVVTFMGAGAYTVAGLFYVRRVNPSSWMYLDLTAAQTISYVNNLPRDVVLEPKDTIFINVDGYTSPQDLRLYIDYMMEKIR